MFFFLFFLMNIMLFPNWKIPGTSVANKYSANIGASLHYNYTLCNVSEKKSNRKYSEKERNTAIPAKNHQD